MVKGQSVPRVHALKTDKVVKTIKIFGRYITTKKETKNVVWQNTKLIISMRKRVIFILLNLEKKTIEIYITLDV